MSLPALYIVIALRLTPPPPQWHRVTAPLPRRDAAREIERLWANGLLARAVSRKKSVPATGSALILPFKKSPAA